MSRFMNMEMERRNDFNVDPSCLTIRCLHDYSITPTIHNIMFELQIKVQMDYSCSMTWRNIWETREVMHCFSLVFLLGYILLFFLSFILV
jgi:hypothetical protein